jgi:hypothetical protein
LLLSLTNHFLLIVVPTSLLLASIEPPSFIVFLRFASGEGSSQLWWIWRSNHYLAMMNGLMSLNMMTSWHHFTTQPTDPNFEEIRAHRCQCISVRWKAAPMILSTKQQHLKVLNTSSIHTYIHTYIQHTTKPDVFSSAQCQS